MSIIAPAWSRRSLTHSPISRRASSLLAALSFILLLSFCWHNFYQVQNVVSTTSHPLEGPGGNKNSLCAQLPGADDVLVVMKTGATEVRDKLAVHLRMTLTCYPNHVIFSDYEEDLPTGEHLYDVFEYTSQTIKDTHRNFTLWRKLQVGGRARILKSEQSGSDSRYKDEDIRMNIPGWQLDKWKFLPMMNRTLELHPDKHWYVFVEADTYLMWSNLLSYLARRSWNDDYYIGNRVAIDHIHFAHGGSGFVLSQPALKKVVELFQKEQHKWEDFTDRYRIGDYVLAAALREAGVVLTNDFSSWQSERLALSKFTPKHEEDSLWCDPALTFHHQSPPSEIEALWKFEQDVISRPAEAKRDGLLRHKDLLEQYILPQIQVPLVGWDNQAGGPGLPGIASLSECEAICEHDKDCMQYVLHSNGTCNIASTVILGEASERVKSGWMTQRVQRLLDDSKPC